ncbi:hypothetical protein [Nocardia rhamnosiphila]|uniref:ATP dependent DNA ligase n=1 Tax=Nocardia rhamnosiphila TaxID=426716 RepID=UPI0004C3AE5A|nr:hypothetical protein [Nocardia rhamnosiphila]
MCVRFASWRTALQRELDGLAVEAPPVAGEVPRGVAESASWVSPKLVGDVTYRERTSSGLRHPVWRGLRFDRSAAEIEMP